MRVAIVGAGVSGLTCAHLLHRDHEIVLYDASSHPGGHVSTVAVETESGTRQVDTGFIVFNDRNYPNFELLLNRLGVATQPSTMSFSVSDGTGDFEYNGASANGLFAKRSHATSPKFLRMVRDLRRFNRAAPALVGLNGSGPSLREFLDQGGYSRTFVERLIVPQAAAVWSADPAQMGSFPASFLADFFENHGMFGLVGRPNWRTVRGGSARYVEALVDPFRDRMRLAGAVRSIRRGPEGVEVRADGSETELFDEVIVAVHSDQALGILEDATGAEREILGAIPYQENEVVLHTDNSLLPRRRRAWASWNYHLLESPRERSTVTYHMNRLQSLETDLDLCVTLNLTERIDPSKVLRTIDCAHPVFTREGIKAQTRWSEVSGSDRIHFCGAYWGYGFHEDGVVSALRVCEQFGKAL